MIRPSRQCGPHLPKVQLLRLRKVLNIPTVGYRVAVLRGQWYTASNLQYLSLRREFKNCTDYQIVATLWII